MRLPPLNALRAFEAAARHGGYIPAADELCVTRGAVSRQVKILEAHLGAQLFRRHPNGVDLTEAGRKLLPVLTEAFESVARAADRVATAATDLRIICPPATSLRWLLPRLDLFRAAHPEINLRLTTDFHGESGFDRQDYDLGFSCDNWPGRLPDVDALPLFPIRLSPACAPSLLAGDQRLETPADLRRFTLLHETTSRTDWSDWLSAFAVETVDPATGDVFSNLDMATKAATLGSGVVMADLVLCREELDRGLLVRPFPDMTCTSPFGNVCLLGLRDRWKDPKVRAFTDWVLAQGAEEAERLASG